jgi:energy-coupling factor transporter ATP-binding protein EcfA2
MVRADNIKNLQGSIWHRWEPHIHTPGTVLNNQYGGGTTLEDFVRKIESSNPSIKALGITDYYSIDRYEEIYNLKQTGKLKDVDLIFPNIEIRFAIGTSANNPINAHLLISPDDINHIEQARRFLRELTFSAYHETFHCDKNDLIKLGKAHDKKITVDSKALEAGSNQFKVDFNQLKEKISASKWAKENILLGIAVSSTDGSSGLQSPDGSFSTLRSEIEKRAELIFSGSLKQRYFWLGKGAASVDELIEKWNGCKPCLHGSDAHDEIKVGNPDMGRYCWIKGDLKFESLRQACIEPETRAYIGLEPLIGGVPTRTIANVTINNAPWLKRSEIPINPGLVAIIGPRGSGKTALADLIAAGSYSLSAHMNERSFVKRAQDLIKDEEVIVEWQSGDETKSALKKVEFDELFDSPKVQYLSQQFVEELCSADGLTDRLLSEIERVIFQAHPIGDRLGTSNFNELSELKCNASRTIRNREENILSDYSTKINQETEKKNGLNNLKNKFTDLEKRIAADKLSRTKLVGNDTSRDKEHSNVTEAIDKIRSTVDKLSRQLLAYQNLKTEIDRVVGTNFKNYPNTLIQKFPDVDLNDDEKKNFELQFKGDVAKLLAEKIKKVSSDLNLQKGATLPAFVTGSISLIPAGGELSKQSLNLLNHELQRIQSLIGIDKDNATKYAALSDKIAKDEKSLENLGKEIKEAEGAEQKIKDLLQERKETYKTICQAIIEEQDVLTSLYEPLMKNLKAETGTLSKLTFNVRRIADIKEWAYEGEQLLDLRKAGSFRGRGSLLEEAKTSLLKSWETETADEISEAIDKFRQDNVPLLLEHAPFEKTDRVSYRDWLKKFANWLYGTRHISVTYGLQYDGVDIKQLSPGTRGIVLLLLYLSIDKEDDRPLIIDQPEENLDPKSVNDELVPRFRDAKIRRQIIIITHNANLVVNTDADQVIIASGGDHRNGELPLINYESGGLENPQVRDEVCKILEGGEKAFKERAKRLRVIL